MTDQKPKSTIRQLLESGPTDPLLLAKLTLLEQLQTAHTQNDQNRMLEIGRELAENEKAFKAAKEHRQATMATAVAEAKAVADADERTKSLLSAFEVCVKLACAASEQASDTDTYNFGVKQLREISDELRALNRFPALAQFLDSPDIELRGFAAVWLRDLWPARILPMLKEINKTEGFGTPVGTQVYIAMRELERAGEQRGKNDEGATAKP